MMERLRLEGRLQQAEGMQTARLLRGSLERTSLGETPLEPVPHAEVGEEGAPHIP